MINIKTREKNREDFKMIQQQRHPLHHLHHHNHPSTSSSPTIPKKKLFTIHTIELKTYNLKQPN